MFGTNRRIERFALRVHKLENDALAEKCSLWGCISYTAEIDFRDRHEDDTVEIHLWLRPSRFDSLCAFMVPPGLEALNIQLTQVSGFYAPWSPSISTDEVKILAADDDQKVLMPDGCEIVPSTLRSVGKFNLTLTRNAMPAPAESPADEDERLGEDRSEFESNSAPSAAADSQVLLAQLGRTVFQQLRTPLWLIVVLLLLLMK